MQVRPGSASILSGIGDKTQQTCSELWTKDVVEYLQTLLDEFFSKNSSHFTHNRDRSPQLPYTASLQHRSDQLSVSDGEEPSLHFKWWYIVRLLQWHHTEGLLIPSLIIDWVLRQLQVIACNKSGVFMEIKLSFLHALLISIFRFVVLMFHTFAPFRKNNRLRFGSCYCLLCMVF